MPGMQVHILLVMVLSVVIPLALCSPVCAQVSTPIPMRETLQNDLNGDGQAGPGDTLRYTITITNLPAAPPATAIQFTDTPDANTTLAPGSVHSTPMTFDQTVTTNEDSPSRLP